MAPVGSVFARPFTAIFAAAFLFGAAPAIADDLPSPRIDCTKPGNKKKPACKPHRSSDDAVINGAYWLSHTGKHAEALALLGTVVDQENPRFLNAMGYTTRKLGNVDGALPYYARALEIEPDYVQVRESWARRFWPRATWHMQTSNWARLNGAAAQAACRSTISRRKYPPSRQLTWKTAEPSKPNS